MRLLVKVAFIPILLPCYAVGIIAKLFWEMLITGWWIGEKFCQWIFEEA